MRHHSKSSQPACRNSTNGNYYYYISFLNKMHLCTNIEEAKFLRFFYFFKRSSKIFGDILLFWIYPSLLLTQIIIASHHSWCRQWQTLTTHPSGIELWSRGHSPSVGPDSRSFLDLFSLRWCGHLFRHVTWSGPFLYQEDVELASH